MGQFVKAVGCNPLSGGDGILVVLLALSATAALLVYTALALISPREGGQIVPV